MSTSHGACGQCQRDVVDVDTVTFITQKIVLGISNFYLPFITILNISLNLQILCLLTTGQITVATGTHKIVIRVECSKKKDAQVKSVKYFCLS